ncbi:MAG TPA: exosortase E/protease, VPEID-CTERM system [Bryobacteraceae bacterium]|jgi:exosortase E/protease (VPEID-CTERM system)|nr:exosortase E/protease, VPEID-CTERM system [Bryobacteraceae bacterium]
MGDTEQPPGVSTLNEPLVTGSLPDSSNNHSFTRIPVFSLSLPNRLILFALLFAAEWSPITRWVHKGYGGGALLQVAIAFSSLLLALGYFRSKDAFQRISNDIRKTPIRWGLLALHLVALAAFLGLSSFSSGNDLFGYAIAGLWYATGAAAIVLAGWALVPPALALDFIRTTGYAWVYALGAAILAWRAVVSTALWNGAVWNPAIDLSWKPATDLTFNLVKAMLHLCLSQVVADRATMTIGSPKFSVIILPWCAGFEGTALMLVFSVAWLAYFRREFRFPHALLLVPAGMVVIWLSNALRITALILIGVAGAPQVAEGGFHSQAGWIAFNCVALSFAILTRHMPWFASNRLGSYRTEVADTTAIHNPTAAYLTPFLAILATAMISRAASGSFEWLYPLRFVAAAAVLWFFRSKYLELDWRFGGFSVMAGCAVFGLWLGLDFLAGAHSSSALAAGLATLPSPARITWLVFRTIAAVVTVPIAEELAFRGFLIRRLTSADFESLSPRHFTYIAVLVSSVGFGLLHGDRWLAGTLAGLIYAVVFLRRGRIGDAVVAHATTNALLAARVLLGGKWDLW